MDTRSLCQLCLHSLLLVLFCHGVTEAAWTLTGSSEFAVVGESFILTCNPQDSNAIAINWKRLDIDTSSTGTNRAVVEANGCRIGQGSDTQYQYTCEPGPIYKLTIPGNVMTNSQNNKVWRCEFVFGGAGKAADYTVTVAEAAWTLTGSSEFAVAGESFILTCNPQDSNALGIKWKRLNIDTTTTDIATIEANGCKVGQGSDTQYQYTCEPGPIYKLTIPANVMTNSQNNKVWRCEFVFGGAGKAADYTATVAVPVSNVYVQESPSGNQQVNVIPVYENIQKTIYCITTGCRPRANVTVTTTGVTKGQFTEEILPQNGDLTITRVSQVITTTRGGSTTKTIQCLAVNIQGRQPIISQLATIVVYYIPSVEPTMTGYTTGTILYEGDNDITLTCQQSGGYPLSVITWACDGQTGTTNNSHTVASSYVRLTVNKNLNGRTCTCTVRHPDNNLAYTRTLSVTFTAYYPLTTPTIQTSGASFPWVENTQGVLKCVTTPGFPTATTYEWIQNGQVINGQTSETFTIPSLSYKHNGLRIQCRVSNGYTTQRPPTTIISNTLILDVQYTPIISLNKTPVVVTEFQGVKRTCLAIGNPTPTVNWYRDNRPYTSSTGTSATLIIQTVTRNDTGTYTCKAAPTGNQRNIFTNVEDLQIYVYYISINKPAPVCSSSESISISCCSVINSSRPLRFHGWTHRIGNTNIRSFDGNLLSTYNNSLSINYCGYYDSGIYTCEAAVDINNNNTWQHFNSSIEIIVPAPPVVSSNSIKDKVADNRKTMSVQFYSVPKPVSVEWNKDGEKLTYSNKYQQITSVTNVTLLFYTTSVYVQGYESSLSILNPVESDFSSYIFRVQNSEGSAQIKLQLNKDIVNDTHHGNMIGAVVGGVIAFIVIISITTVVICIFKRRRKNQNSCSAAVKKTDLTRTLISRCMRY